MKLSDEALEKLTSKELIVIIRHLEARVEALELEMREIKRAKAPFTKGERKKNPKKPGRKKGKGSFTRRKEPVATSADVVREVNVPLADDQRQCPQCLTPLEIKAEIATIEDTPAQPKRLITRFTVEVGKCPHCLYQARGRHPELSRSQNGATAHQVGINVKAHALALHYHSGLPLCKVPQVIKQITGISIGQSALTQMACSWSDAGGRLHGEYEALRKKVASSRVVNTDDTGWRINATLAFLMGFFTADTAYYQIRYRHRHEEVLEVLGPLGKGRRRFIGTDRGKSYDAEAMAGEEMQKCLSHLLKNLSEVEKTKTGRAKHFSSHLKELLREGLELWKSYHRGEHDLMSYRRQGQRLQERIQHHLRDRVLQDDDNQRLLNGIGYQEDRDRVTLFLREPEIEPTNNRAERGLRGAVIARKVSHCSKNARGAQTYATMKSIFATLAYRTKDVVQCFASILRGQPLAAIGGR